MGEAKILVPLAFGGIGRTGVLTLRTNPKLDPGFHPGACMAGIPMPAPPGQQSFLAAANLAYRVGLNLYGLSAGLSIEWCLTPCGGGRFPGLSGGSAGAAFELALTKLRASEHNPRSLRRHVEVEAIEAVRLEWVAASATIGCDGEFGYVDKLALEAKLLALTTERPNSRVRLAVISTAQQNRQQPQNNIALTPVDKMPGLFLFDAGVPGVIPVICASNADDCYRQLFRLQSQQVLQ